MYYEGEPNQTVEKVTEGEVKNQDHGVQLENGVLSAILDPHIRNCHQCDNVPNCSCNKI